MAVRSQSRKPLGQHAGMRELDRLLRWGRDLAAARSTTHRVLTGGDAFANSRFPDAHDHNFVLLDSGPALAEAEAFFVAEGITHRLIEAHEDLASELAGQLPGYERATDVLMSWSGGELPASSFIVEELDLAERCAVAEAEWRELMPAAVARQLGRRAETLTDACDPCFLGVRDSSGRVLSRVDLLVEGGVAQVEELITTPAARNRGIATALVRDAIRRATDDDVFLIAEHGSRPAAMYRRLGFREVGTKTSFTAP